MENATQPSAHPPSPPRNVIHQMCFADEAGWRDLAAHWCTARAIERLSSAVAAESHQPATMRVTKGFFAVFIDRLVRLGALLQSAERITQC